MTRQTTSCGHTSASNRNTVYKQIGFLEEAFVTDGFQSNRKNIVRNIEQSTTASDLTNNQQTLTSAIWVDTNIENNI